MKKKFSRCRALAGLGILLLVLGGNNLRLQANPTGGTVTQGSATFSTSGSQFTINQTSANAFINWQTFNIAAGEITTFNQPSATSVTWNQINDSNPSQILGTLNANGYVILQNPNGFYVGGQATINAHGLVMTTASTPALNLSSGGPWSFNTPPPTAKIVNYGQINIAGGGSAFLIANDIENNGTISAPGGKIGLYAGQTVLLSTSPDGRGLSAQVTIPQGLVDNNGNLSADGGSIALQAQMVNQNGVIQANSAQNVNGTIELVAGNTVNLGANSTTSAEGGSQATSPGGVTVQGGNIINNNGQVAADGSSILMEAPTVSQNGILQANSLGNANGAVEIDASKSLSLGATSQINANGDSTASSASPGGFVVLHGANSFADASGSAISVSGQAGGQSGIVEIFGNGVTVGSLNSSLGDPYALFINPNNLTLSTGLTSTSASNPNLNVNDLLNYSQVFLYNIELASQWNLGDANVPATLNWSAMNNITLNGSLIAGNDWNVNLTAGTAYSGTIKPGSDGIYVNNVLQTGNGNITLNAANEIIVGNAVRTVGGGNIDVTAQDGNVNTGTGANGFTYLPTAPYYNVSGNLSGISTAAGGDVTINAGGDVISFPTTTVAAGDPGTGAFGSEPGNVTINAGGSVYGNYVVMNGAGVINAGQNIGTSVNNQNVALSLAKGSWTLDAQGNIYLQEVRNPNGVFNDTLNYHTHPFSPSAGSYLFDYAPNASATLTAGNGVYLTGYDLPRPDGVSGAVPLLLPPIVIINAGAGGVTLQTPSAVDSTGKSVTLLNSAITLFPSAYGNLEITTTDGGGLMGVGSGVTLLMSDSGRTQWFNTVTTGYTGPQPFGEGDDASVPAELNNPNPVVLNIAGDMENLTLQVSKFAQINVGGNMIGCTFYGENLQPNQTTSINVGGQIYNAVSFTSVVLNQAFPTLPAELLPPGDANSLFQILALAVNPTQIASLPGTTSASEIYKEAGMFPGLNPAGVSYNPNTKTLTFLPTVSGSIVSALEQPTLTFVVYQNGVPKVDSSGHFVTETIPWTSVDSANYSQINKLYTDSQLAPRLGEGGYIVGGTGTFDVTANSISLGTSYGILSVGSEGSVHTYFGRNYSFLAPYITSGATINVTVLGQEQIVNGQTEPSLYMPASAIAALAGGDVNVTCTGEMPNPNGSGGVSMDLGSADLVDFYDQIMNPRNGQSGTGIALGIYTTGGGNVNVTAQGDINVDTSRIATFNGGNVFVESYTGNVNAGSGGSTFVVPVVVFSSDVTDYGQQVYANGIVAETLTDPSAVPGGATAPGNITVWTPEGDINANVGGIKQEALNGTAPAGPTITLTAGTPAPGQGFDSSVPPLYLGNIDLGTIGAIGETIIAQATGTITGLAVSQHNTSITSQSVGSLTVLAGGMANVSAQSSGSGAGITIIGGQGVNASGIGAGATLLGQNVSVNGGAATSTLGTTAASTAASQSAAGQSSSAAQQQVASNSGEEKKKKKKKKAELVRSVGRVTVILPKDS